VITHDVPSGPAIAMALSVPVVPVYVLPVWPSMMTGSRVLVGVHTTENVAPVRGAPAWSTFTTRRSPPTTKQAGPALRLLAWALDGAAVVLPTLQNSEPTTTSVGMSTVNWKMNGLTVLGTPCSSKARTGSSLTNTQSRITKSWRPVVSVGSKG
jgi:hypothetical protein